MDVSAGTLAHLPVQYPVVQQRSSPLREGELLLRSDASSGGGLSTRRQPGANVTVLVVAVRTDAPDETLTARDVTPTPGGDRLALDPDSRRGLSAYDAVLTMGKARTRGFHAVA